MIKGLMARHVMPVIGNQYDLTTSSLRESLSGCTSVLTEAERDLGASVLSEMGGPFDKAPGWV